MSHVEQYPSNKTGRYPKTFPRQYPSVSKSELYTRTFILGKQNRSFKRINLNILIKITDFYKKKLDALKPVLRPESDVQLHIRCTKLSELSS